MSWRTRCVVNIDEVEFRKEVIEFNVDTEDENVGRKKSYADTFIHWNKKRHNLKT